MTTFPLETSEQHALVAVPIVLIVLASICVGLRFRARKIQRAKLLLEDWLCLLTLVCVPLSANGFCTSNLIPD
jgi:hypothetical protein